MKIDLLGLKAVQTRSGKSVAESRWALQAAQGDVEDAIELLSRPPASMDGSPFDDSDWFTGPPLTRRVLQAAQAQLGFKFPAAYANLLFAKNGGCVTKNCFAVDRPTSWARDHIAISGIRGIGGKHGIDSAIERSTNAEWGYPAFGFVFAATPTAGHTVVMFDYSGCGDSGEPRVAWVDVYGEQPEVIVLAPNFTEFLAGLTEAHMFEDGDSG